MCGEFFVPVHTHQILKGGYRLWERADVQGVQSLTNPAENWALPAPTTPILIACDIAVSPQVVSVQLSTSETSS
jgi:hypothetical protein